MPAPLELTAEVTAADGRVFRWASSDPAARNRLRNLSFSTKVGEGFSSAQGQLARRIDLDYPDLNLVDNVSFVGADGSVAWEGRVSAMPRELSDTHSIGVTLTGWMAHAKDRKFTEIYVDRDMKAWGPMSVTRRANLLGINLTFLNGPDMKDDPTGNQAFSTGFDGSWTSPYKPAAEAWYDAGSARIGKLLYNWAREGGVSNADPAWSWSATLSDDDQAITTDGSGNLIAVGPSGGTLTATRNTRRYASVTLAYTGTPAGAAGIPWGIKWSNLTVYGTHGLSLYTGEPGQADGVLASDVIKNIASRWCPAFNTNGVQKTNYVIQHLAFKDRTFPYDAFLEINKYHLWNLGVWENKTLTYGPYNLEDYDWEIRTDEPGTTFSPQGPSVDDLAGGVAVTYTDALTGLKTTLTPDNFPSDLKATDPTNPWIAHGVENWAEIELSTPTIQAQALQLGRAALADRNTPKTPGTITVKGYIRDRQGNEQPVWKVRGGDTISITNFPNDSPRPIIETSYDDENKTVSLSIDRPFALLDAYLDRVGTAMTARGLS